MQGVERLRGEVERLLRRQRTLPVGPWRGVALDDVPPRHLRHALETLDLGSDLRRRIMAILAERQKILRGLLAGQGRIEQQDRPKQGR